MLSKNELVTEVTREVLRELDTIIGKIVSKYFEAQRIMNTDKSDLIKNPCDRYKKFLALKTAGLNVKDISLELKYSLSASYRINTILSRNDGITDKFLSGEISMNQAYKLSKK